jgi:hypothetical protein
MDGLARASPTGPSLLCGHVGNATPESALLSSAKEAEISGREPRGGISAVSADAGRITAVVAWHHRPIRLERGSGEMNAAFRLSESGDGVESIAITEGVHHVI